MNKSSGRLAAAVAVLLALLVPTVLHSSARASAASSGSSGGSPGYWLVGSNGEVFQVGTSNYGDLRNVSLARPVVGGAPTTDGLGYWLVASDGGIFAFGDARFHGSTGSIRLNKPIVGMAADPVTGGYWLVASDGGIFAFDAPFYGSTGGIRLNKPVVGMAPTPTGHGYWLVASDGGIFAFGDARFYGSTGGITLAKPVVGMAALPSGGGYWMVASDGGIFAFGHAAFRGSTGGIRLNSPVVGMASTASGNGYWLAASDGGIFTFGDAPFLGTPGTNGSPPIVGFMATYSGYPFPPGGTGYDVSQYQCPYYAGQVSPLPSPHGPVTVVQVSGGAINRSQPARCYPLEAAWAGATLSDYIFMNPLPSPAPSEAMTGPAGNCSATNVNCQSFNFGYFWARHWVDYAHNAGTHPTLWWLDVETTGGWNTAAGAQPSNAQVVAGAVAGLRAAGMTPGIYATNLQWGEITGNRVSFPHIALWIPGAENLSSGSYSATSFCSIPPQPVDFSKPTSFYAPFAGGTTVLVQYDYNDPNRNEDFDYACR